MLLIEYSFFPAFATPSECIKDDKNLSWILMMLTDLIGQRKPQQKDLLINEKCALEHRNTTFGYNL